MPHRVDATGRRLMAPSSPSSTRPRVVVVMDGPLARVLEVVLEHGGYEGRVPTGALEFGDLLQKWAPHVVLIDLDSHPEFLRLSQSINGGGPPPPFTHKRETARKVAAFEGGAGDNLR